MALFFDDDLVKEGKLIDKMVAMPKDLYDHLQTVLKTYPQYSTQDGYKRLKGFVDSGYNDRDGKPNKTSDGSILVRYGNLKRIKHDFKGMKQDENNVPFLLNGGFKMLNWVNNVLGKEKMNVKKVLPTMKVKPNSAKDAMPKKEDTKPIKVDNGQVTVHEGKKTIYINESQLLGLKYLYIK